MRVLSTDKRSPVGKAESLLDSRPFELPIAEAAGPGIGARGVTVPGTLRVPEEILPPGIAFRESLIWKRAVLLPSLGVDREDMPERDGIGILADVEPALDLPAELRGADCLRLFLAIAMDSAIRITATAASKTAVGFSFDSFIFSPPKKAVSDKTGLSILLLLF